MSDSTFRRWSPIEALPSDWSKWVNPELQGLVDEWQGQREELESRNEYKNFLIRLRRQWAIETGVLERLYSISTSATKTLIEKGFDASLLSHDDTDKQPWEVLALIKDQHAAIESLYQFVGGERPMGTSYLKELHRLLTQHQESYEAIDSLGQRVQRNLIRGDWKQEPNFVEFQDGGRIEFCPPYDVDPEMQKLMNWFGDYESGDPAPAVAGSVHCAGLGPVAEAGRCLGDRSHRPPGHPSRAPATHPRLVGFTARKTRAVHFTGGAR
jgi:hypothetical protein